VLAADGGHGHPRGGVGGRDVRTWAWSSRTRTRGLVKIAKPVGVVAALIPTTWPRDRALAFKDQLG
jgi:hypothetical protein